MGGAHGPRLRLEPVRAARPLQCVARCDLRRLRPRRCQGDGSRPLSRLHPRDQVRRRGDDRHPAVRAAHPPQPHPHLPPRQGVLLHPAHPERQRQRRPARRDASLERGARRDLLRQRAVRALRPRRSPLALSRTAARRLRAEISARAHPRRRLHQHDAGPGTHHGRLLRLAGDRRHQARGRKPREARRPADGHARPHLPQRRRRSVGHGTLDTACPPARGATLDRTARGRSRPFPREGSCRQRHVAALAASPFRAMRDVGVGMDLAPPPATRLRQSRPRRRPLDHGDRLRPRLQQLGAFQHHVPPQVRDLAARRRADVPVFEATARARPIRRPLRSPGAPGPRRYSPGREAPHACRRRARAEPLSARSPRRRP